MKYEINITILHDKCSILKTLKATTNCFCEVSVSKV